MNTACTLPGIMNHSPLLRYNDSQLPDWGCSPVTGVKEDMYDEESQRSEVDISSQPRLTDENSQSSSSSTYEEENGYYSSKAEGLDNENGGDSERTIFTCPVCSLQSTSRMQFTEHISNHCSHKCSFCEVTCQNLEDLQRHLAEEHENDDEPGVRIPRINTQGKVKTFRCKQCSFIAVTKLDFWEHSKCHIKVEKLLTCPKCPFVTEYKHHLEYHLRNHFKSKPFKCTQCSYSCVNKSMLNSHLKSHSNVYQYHCADCSYATKYCHSLKLHLRKYSHKPAMVLNADGSPNPLPIIDVYGTRRGPKQKPKLMLPEDNVRNPEISLFQASYSIMSNSQQQGNLPIPFPYGSFLNSFTVPHPNSLLSSPSNVLNNHTPSESMNNSHDIMESYLDKMLLSAYNNNNNKNSSNSSNDDIIINEPQQEKKAESEEKKSELEENKNNSAPLDLSKPESNENGKIVKHRRKGKAFKLERITVENSKNEYDEKKEPNPTAQDQEKRPATETYTCSYCDITFKDIIMYTMHMGYHGYEHPFQCNMCGEETSDKVSFFLHIARSSHS